MEPMARPPRQRPASAAGRFLRFFATNLLILGGGMTLLWLGYRVLHHPQVTAPPVAVPAGLSVGTAPAAVASGDYRVALDGARWVSQDSLPADLHLTFRARPGPTVDYLVLEVTVQNTGQRPLPFRYEGEGADVRVLLASTDPVSFATAPLSPEEARLIAGGAPLAAGPVPPGAALRGELVFAVERFRKRWSLLVLPESANAPPGAAPQTPAIELRFRP